MKLINDMTVTCWSCVCVWGGVQLYVCIALLSISPAWKYLFKGHFDVLSHSSHFWKVSEYVSLLPSIPSETEPIIPFAQTDIHPFCDSCLVEKKALLKCQAKIPNVKVAPWLYVFLSALCWSLVLLHASFSSELGLFRAWLGTLERRYRSNT